MLKSRLFATEMTERFDLTPALIANEPVGHSAVKNPVK
jgi:hypothetical protein